MRKTHAALRKRLQAALGNEFTVGELLGEGGFAVVFRAKDNALHRDVAVKVVDLQLAASANAAERFVHESRIAAGLEHPHIVPIYKVGGRGDVLYLIMRFVDGPSLRELLAQKGRLSVGDAARIARQVADALAYAHAHGVVHRDVKPDNVLLDRSGHVLVTDFGIAKIAAHAKKTVATGPVTTEGMILGTPQYMSPEQVSGDRLEPPSDIYSLGIVLYQMLAGEPPFDGESAQEILAQHLTAIPTPIREVRSEVPEELAQVLDRMLMKDPARRYQSAAQASRELVEALPTAAHDRVKARGRRVARSLVRLGAVGCLAFAAFVAGAALVLSAVTSDPPALAAHAPAIPDSVVTQLRALGAIGRNEPPLMVFVPNGASLRDGLVVTRGHVIRVGPRRPRRYLADSVDVVWTFRGFALRGGLRAGIVLVPAAGRRDTVFQDLSLRELYEMRSLFTQRVSSERDTTP